MAKRMTNETYVKRSREYGVCPFCETPFPDPIQVPQYETPTEVQSRFQCKDCKRRWIERYTLIGYKEVKMEKTEDRGHKPAGRGR